LMRYVIILIKLLCMYVCMYLSSRKSILFICRKTLKLWKVWLIAQCDYSGYCLWTHRYNPLKR